MKAIALVLVLAFNPSALTDPRLIGKINSLKKEAKNAYEKGDFRTAAKKYEYLVDSLGVHEDEVQLNLANALFELRDSTAGNIYADLAGSKLPTVRSKAQQQLGVLSNKGNHYEEALNHFKASIKSDPGNDEARYNYEMLKRKMDQQQQQNQQDQKKNDQQKNDQQKEDQKKDDQQNQDQQKEDQQNQDQQKEDQQNQQQPNQGNQKDEKQKQELADKLKEMNMSEEKANMILDAMKNQEVQYLQENQKKATKPRDSSKPDW